MNPNEPFPLTDMLFMCLLAFVPLTITSYFYSKICDAIWENPPHVAQGNFTEINKIILKLLCFPLFFINFDNT